MRLIEIIHRPSPVELAELVGFVERMTTATGERPLSDHLWLDLRSGGADGFVVVRIAEPGRTLAIAQVSAANTAASLEVVVDHDLPAGDRRRVRDDAAATAVDAFAAGGGGELVWWLDDPDDDDLAVANGLGLAPGRRLLEMRVTLPLDRRAGIITRSFVPGVDDEAWLAVNNRAFADHGEQGGWTPETLRLRMGEPWFDPDGFRMHEVDGRVAGFCWTKLHGDVEPPMGEIYVIAVDPEFHGRGLGTQLTLAGLDSITDRGLTVGDLWVDAHNAAAVATYERLGFTVHRVRTACGGHIDATAGIAGGDASSAT